MAFYSKGLIRTQRCETMKGKINMFKFTLRYTRYIVSALASIGFRLAAN